MKPFIFSTLVYSFKEMIKKRVRIMIRVEEKRIRVGGKAEKTKKKKKTSRKIKTNETKIKYKN